MRPVPSTSPGPSRRAAASRLACGLLLCWLSVPAQPTQAGAAGTDAPLRPLVAAFHVHSTLSTGTLTLDELAARARARGIDAIVLCENFALRYEYGLPPLRTVLRRHVSIPSVRPGRVDGFLREVAAAQARNPDVIFVPGVEVAPHYYWTGSLLRGDLTMHNSQRNLLVVGLTDPRAYRALPAAGNPFSYRYGWRTAAALSPLALLAPALWLWRHPRRGRRLASGLLALVSLALLLNAWPFGEPRYGLYDASLGYQPYQALIDAATKQGGVVFWSLTEARDHNQYRFGALGTVTVETHPHPEALLETTGFTGFGGVYQDTREAADPGGVWDQALTGYLTGRRAGFPVLVGEIAFHEPGQAGIELHQVLNVLEVREWSAQGVVEALRRGRLHAVGHYPQGAALRLDQFLVEEAASGRRGRAGERLPVGDSTVLTVRVRVVAVDGGTHPVTVRVIRSGRPVASTRSRTPMTLLHLDKIEKSVTPAFYRVEVKAKDAEILSNPIFVVPDGRPAAPGATAG